ncbi:TniB family NTP-binding protein [Burkholderia stagnalis]|uniref:TniB family NTP-binding protein n=1 Tax=Burkholderia stagnalis TaxID=1503054 RepID=UPI000758C0C2|nr:TniB family NTP-binding protein [Burkholderia stagnalis]KVX50657.1 hypothetical protein WT33_33165 [Burkholderia stagnalis]
MTYSEKALNARRALHQIVVNHSSFVQALDGIGRVIQLGNDLGSPIGMCLIAPSGCGKSLLIDLLMRNACGWPFLNTQSVLVAALKEAPTVAHVQSELLKCFKYPIPIKVSVSTNATVNNVLIEAVARRKIQLTAIDEYQHVFLCGKEGVRRAINDWLKRYMTLTEKPVLLTGTEDLSALATADPQISTRISGTFRLMPFKHDAEWKGVLKAYADNCDSVDLAPLRNEYSRELYMASQGVFRALKGLVLESVMIAIDEGATAVNKGHLAAAFLRIFGPASTRENPFQ